MQDFSLVAASGGYSLVVVHGLLIVVASLIAGSRHTASVVVAHELIAPWHVWNLLEPGIEPVCPALTGGFLTTGPPGKSWNTYSKSSFWHLQWERAFRFLFSKMLPCSMVPRATLNKNTLISLLIRREFGRWLIYPTPMGQILQSAIIYLLQLSPHSWWCRPFPRKRLVSFLITKVPLRVSHMVFA